MEIVFASNNIYKLNEIKDILDDSFALLSLGDIGMNEEIPENELSLEGNALSKARHIYDATGLTVFADDTGLEIDALDKRPGVNSARYAGPECNSEKNIRKQISIQ